MGVANAWRFSVISANLALLQHPNGSIPGNKIVCWKWRSSAVQQRKPISWPLICGLMLFCLGMISLFTGHVASDLDWYSQRLVKRSLYFKLDGSNKAPIDIWKSENAKYYYGCSKRSRKFRHAIRERSSNGYLLIAASGGLNQQRTGISDAVVVARILNATLVVPELDHNSYWKDDSDFVNIFDVNWFISYLAKDVTIVKRVPDKFMRSMEKPPYTMRVPRKSPPEYYLDQVLPILKRRHVLQLTKFDYRLANNIDEELQKFEADMLAFSGCYFGGGEKERYELGEIRKRWETLPDLDADGERRRGKCPLTPHEVGLMLRALGFANDTYIYVASGDIYGGEETLRPLRDLFPNFYTKEMLANEELKPFLPFSSRLAAIDYIVCDESDVFVTNNNGNMAKILAGRRRYMGHKRTIRPNAKRLSPLLMERDQMDWDTFARKVKAVQRGFMGEPDEMRPGRGEFHEYPYSCICEKPPSDDVNKSRDSQNKSQEIKDLGRETRKKRQV
ncbi:uncharacterized protein At1g04910-like isoform X2 [Durio zibethinus]|uniref:O-fucosyltransferase family protein n=1 Tax=Durio zibethinus TaxID=66656 RepID=A0A6P5Y6S3_DURZI|nr:uncharacterized protein At1g04910-like isoform X2 [Durio zibethinus]